MWNQVFAIDRRKVWAFEWLSILRKRNLYKHVRYSEEQKKRINELWTVHYGKTVSKRWHRLYESINGVYSERYFPEIVFTTKLEPKINPPGVARVLSDKSLTELIYQGVPGVEFPKTIAVNCSGYYYGESRRITTMEEVLERLITLEEFVIKPVTGGSSGSGVQVIDLSNKSHPDRRTIVQKTLAQYKENYIVQLRVKGQKEYEKLHPHSLNTIRIITYIADNDVYHAPLCLRVGCGHSTVDNIHAGGIGIGVTDDGVLKKYGYQLGYGDSKVKYTCHPNTGVVFEGYKIPGTYDMIDVAKRLHCRTPHLGIVSWDLTMDHRGKIVLIEGNLQGQGVWFPQIVHGEPLFGEQTAYFIKLARD